MTLHERTRKGHHQFADRKQRTFHIDCLEERGVEMTLHEKDKKGSSSDRQIFQLFERHCKGNC